MHADATPAANAAELLRRSLERGRMGHAYLFVGDDTGVLEDAASRLAQTLVCLTPIARADNGVAVAPCGVCSACRRVAGFAHPDVTWIRPGKKTRVIAVSQIRDLMHTVGLRPTEARYKVGIITATDRLRVEAANAFLKTLEEPPADSIFILLTTDADRLLETILSRCLRLNFASGIVRLDDSVNRWVAEFAGQVAPTAPTLLDRYQLIHSLLGVLEATKQQIEEALTASSPLKKYADADADTRDRWEDELAAAVEAEYRRRRGDFLAGLQAWLRDVWLHTVGGSESSFLPALAPLAAQVGRRLSPASSRANLEAWEGTQRLLLGTNAQEALVVEVGLLRLQL